MKVLPSRFGCGQQATLHTKIVEAFKSQLQETVRE